MIGAPDPRVIDDGVVRVDAKVDDGAAHACSADAEENVDKKNRVARVIRMAALRADFDEHWGLERASIDEEAGNNHAIHIGGGECGCALGGFEGGEPEAED